MCVHSVRMADSVSSLSVHRCAFLFGGAEKIVANQVDLEMSQEYTDHFLSKQV